MKRAVVIESCALLVVGIIGLVGGIQSYIRSDARTLSSAMGPGVYILVLSTALILTALAYAYIGLKRSPVARKASADEPRGPWTSKIVVMVFGVFAAYAYLIQWIGYLPSTVLFLLAEFRLLGVRSWRQNLLLTALVTAVFYIVFIKYGEMVFPHGSLFE